MSEWPWLKTITPLASWANTNRNQSKGRKCLASHLGIAPFVVQTPIGVIEQTTSVFAGVRDIALIFRGFTKQHRFHQKYYKTAPVSQKVLLNYL